MRLFIKRLAFISKDQRGFTLIELMIAIAITALIVVGLTITIFQLFGGHAQSSGEMTVIRQVQNAGYHISRDAQMTWTGEEELIIGDDPDTTDYVEVVTLTWYWYTYHGGWEPPRPADRGGVGF